MKLHLALLSIWVLIPIYEAFAQQHNEGTFELSDYAIQIDGSTNPTALSTGKAFQKMLFALDAFRTDLSPADYQVLVAFKAQSSAFALGPDDESIENLLTLCDRFVEGRRIDEVDVVAMAREAENVAFAEWNRQDQTYLSVLDSLTPEGKEYVQGKAVPMILAGTAHMRLDYTALSHAHPEFMQQMFYDGCQGSKSVEGRPRQELAHDNFVPSDPLDSRSLESTQSESSPSIQVDQGTWY